MTHVETRRKVLRKYKERAMSSVVVGSFERRQDCGATRGAGTGAYNGNLQAGSMPAGSTCECWGADWPWATRP